LLIFASPSVAQDIKSVSTTSVGTGFMGVMGNKGAVTARVILGETTRLVFINSHLSAGADKTALDRRNWDASQITSRTKFDPIDDITGISQCNGETIGEEDFAFWFGDLNYRLERMPGEDIRRLLMLHTGDEYDTGQSKSAPKSDQETADTANVPNSHSADEPSRSFSPAVQIVNSELDGDEDDNQELDPTSLQVTVQSLLTHDELLQQIKARKAFHEGWKEGPIRFLPTYKYDVGSVGMFDSSDKKRCPSWCDRILYRTRRDYDVYKVQARVEEVAKRHVEEMKTQGTEKAENDDVLFDYDPEEDGEQYNPDIHSQQPETITTKEGFEDEIQLEFYVAHQRILSSDHKPLDAVFTLKYDAVIPEAKARIHKEVARELDRAENEGRPTITVIIDRPYGEEDLDDELDEVDGIVNFGRVRVGQGKHRAITIANTGRVPATLSFVDRPVGSDQVEGPHPAWLTINWDRDPDVVKNKKSKDSPTYTLEPGDACNLDLVVHVDTADLTNELNEGLVKLDDNLILRVQNGRDHFLPISGKWVHSELESSINMLNKIAEEAIRKLQNQEPEGSGAGSRPDSRSA